MYQLRLPCLDAEGQPLIHKQITVYLADATTPATLYDYDDAVRSSTFVTDASGLIDFRVPALVTLVFKVHTGLSLGLPLPLYSVGVLPPPPAEIRTVEIGTVGATPVLAGRAVTTDPTGNLIMADALTIAHCGAVCGVAIQTGNPGAPVKYTDCGYVTNEGWTFTPNIPVYLGENGQLIQGLIPGNLLFIQPMGTAVSATKLMLNIAPPIRRA